MIFSSLYSLRKSRQILKTCYEWYKKKSRTLSLEQKLSIEKEMETLDQALLNQNKKEASQIAQRLEIFNREYVRKSLLEYTWELVFALGVALVIAILVRQMWFELYEIPTGSMRPTFKEQDHLTVSKTAFGINYPLETQHLYFEPQLVQRTSVVIFSGDNLPMEDTDSTFLYVIPYKKRYIKRLIGKPGDALYFYGGKIYGIDKEGNPIEELVNSPWLNKIEYIPFLRFSGDITLNQGIVSFNQMHQTIGRLVLSSHSEPKGQIFNGKEWIRDQLSPQKAPHPRLQTYGDFWGIKNFAMARLLNREQAKEEYSAELKSHPDVRLFLELSHNPSLAIPPRSYNTFELNSYKTVIPLNQSHLETLMNNMYTARFIVKEGRATRYNIGTPHFGKHSPLFPHVPDGTYEFYYGKAYQIGLAGIPSLLPPEHPLYRLDVENVQRLYNLGVEFHASLAPNRTVSHFPSRYAYFREGDLYALGAPLFKKEDPLLSDFLKTEEKKEAETALSLPYVAFKDHGPPLKEGVWDKEFIRTFGLTIPEKQYFVLGNNHAMSADSRVFGFVPEANLQGAPSLIIWPPGERLGPPAMKPYPLFNVSRIIIWGIALIVSMIWYAIHRKRMRTPLFKKVE